MPKREPVAVVTADTHIQKRTWNHKPIFEDAYFGFCQIVDYAVEQELPIIGAGDLINYRVNEPEPIVFLREQLKRLEDLGLKFYYIQGQHELDDTPWMQLGANAVHLHERLITVDYCDLSICGLDYQPKDKFQEALDRLPSAEVLVTHQVWSDFMGSITLPQGSFNDIPGPVETVITGDYHGETILDSYRGRDDQNLLVFNPGPTHMLKIDEDSPKHFGVLYSNASVQKFQLKTRKFDYYLLSRKSEIEEFIENYPKYLEEVEEYATVNDLPEALQKPILRIGYPHRLSEDMRRIGKVVDNKAHLFWNEIPPTQEESVKNRNLVNVPVEGEALTLEGCLTEAVDSKKEPQTFKLAQRLLQADEKELEVRRWLKEQTDDKLESG